MTLTRVELECFTAFSEIGLDLSRGINVLVGPNVPIMRGPMDPDRKRLLATLQKAIEGRVAVKNEEFFLRSKEGNLEFSLVAEGIRKLALLWLLIQNGVLQEGSVLLWDGGMNLKPTSIPKCSKP